LKFLDRFSKNPQIQIPFIGSRIVPSGPKEGRTDTQNVYRKTADITQPKVGFRKFANAA